MSPDDVPHDEMDERRHDEDERFERLLEGSAEARERFPELAVFVDDLQLISTASPAVEDLHVAAMMSETVHLLAEKGDPVVRPVSNAHGPASQASGLPTRRSVQMKRLLAKVMAPLIAVFTVMGGLAYAEALPGPVQKAVAGAAGAVGIDLPDGSDATEADDPADTDLDDESDDVRGDDDQGEDGDSQGENDDSQVDDDQGENDDSQGEDGDDQGENEDSQVDDDQGENDDSQGEDGDEQGENEDNGGSAENDDQGQDKGDDQGQNEGTDSGDDSGSGGDQGSGSGGDED